MDIRTKLVFALVAVALVSMIALSGFMYLFTNRQLKQSRLEQLEGYAESAREGLVQITSGWEDRVNLIARRSQLREILFENNLEGNPLARSRVRQILADAYRAERAIESLVVYDREGKFVGSAGWGTDSTIAEQLTTLPNPESGVRYEGVFTQVDPTEGREEVRVGYSAALTNDGTPAGDLVGVLKVRITTAPLERLTRNREGLGATGEIVIAIGDSGERARVLERSGLGTPAAWKFVDLRGPDDPIFLAMSGAEGPFSEGIVDHRGEPVWAAVRYLPDLDWGVVAKIDQLEGRSPALAYREDLTNVVISLAALAILVGTFLGLRFAKPIHELAATASRIKEGDLSVRAKATSEDEVGLLARNFNQMADELEQQVTLLREFQNYFDLSLDMLCIAGYDGYFKRVNPAFERVLGWSTEELMSRKFLDFVHPDDLEKTEKEIARLAQGLPTISFENRYQCLDGSEKHLAWTAHPEPETGLIYAIARDVSDLKRERRVARERIEYLRNRLEQTEAKLGDKP